MEYSEKQNRYKLIPECWDTFGNITKDSNPLEELKAYNDAYNPESDSLEPDDYYDGNETLVWHFGLSDFDKYIDSLKD